MNRSTISLKEMMNYIWKKKLFLIIWIIAINSIFIFYIKIQPKSEFKAKVKYEFPQPEFYIDSDKELINYYKRRKLFNEDALLLENDAAKQIIDEYNLMIKKGNGLILQFSIVGNDSTDFRDKLQRIEILIDSLYISSKIQKYNEDINMIYAKILEIEVLKETVKNNLEQKRKFDEYSIIGRNLNSYYEHQITKKYSYENLPVRKFKEIEIDNLSTKRKLLVVGSIIFSIWSGLMIVIIRYFIKNN